jgi:hypothetical protein
VGLADEVSHRWIGSKFGRLPERSLPRTQRLVVAGLPRHAALRVPEHQLVGLERRGALFHEMHVEANANQGCSGSSTKRLG